jgi:hypothetical protein
VKDLHGGQIMVARLGNVLYWAGSGIAILLLAIATVSAAWGQGDHRWFPVGLFIAVAVVTWLIGRACRYVLSGR